MADDHFGLVKLFRRPEAANDWIEDQAQRQIVVFATTIVPKAVQYAPTLVNAHVTYSKNVPDAADGYGTLKLDRLEGY